MKGVPRALVSRYARSLFAVARERQALDAIRRDLQNIHELWEQQPELMALLLNPGLSRRKVKAILDALAGKLALHEITRSFVAIVLEKDRLVILTDVQPVFERLVFEFEGKIEVVVTTAVPVTENLQKQIVQHLKTRSGKDPVVDWRQNPALIGGIVVEWPDHVFDGSLARKLRNMQAQLAGYA